LQVKEVTLDMAKNMEAAVKEVFKNALLVTDRFHVIKLAIEALQHARVKLRWNELDSRPLKTPQSLSSLELCY
jgi:transposase